MTHVFQQILCYWAWLKQDTYWMANDQAACADASASIKIMLAQIQTLWPRKDGLHWNLTKLHEQMVFLFEKNDICLSTTTTVTLALQGWFKLEPDQAT
jgi:hypothetical protein